MTQPIAFKTLILRNFLSFGNNYTEIDLTFEGSTLVNGENVDSGTANGAGKTTILNALVYSLYNKPADNISLQRLINSTNSSKDTLMEVKLLFTKGEDEFEIYRCRGGSTNIELTCNGEDITFDSVSENDKFIEELVGISYELFTKVVIFSNNSTPFLMQPISHQRQQIEELFKITELSEKAIILREKIKQIEADVNIQEAVIKEKETAKALHERHLKEAKLRVDRWETSRTSDVKELSDTLDEIKDVDFEAEEELHSAKAEIAKEITPIQASILTTESAIKILIKDIGKLEGELAHLADDKCPYCMQQYADAPHKIEEKRTKLKEKQDDLAIKQVQLDEYKGIETELKAAQVEIEGMIKHKNLKEHLTIKNNRISYENKLKSLRDSINPHLEAYNNLFNEESKEIDYAIVDGLKNDLEHQNFLLKLLTDKNSFIRRKIINKTIPLLNRRLNVYTYDLGLPHVVKFDSDMSCTVSEHGRELDFGNLSNGEKKRVNIAMSLAFRDILHRLHSRFNLLMVDELDGGAIDTIGMDCVIKLLKQKNRDDGVAVWMISHKPEAIGRFDRDIVVRKENGFSSVIV